MYGNTSIMELECHLCIAYIDIVFVKTIITWKSFRMTTKIFNDVVANNT
jgi:hypothetical protein